MARANIRQIEAFNAVMSQGSATRAAKSLFITQPAVTKLIKAFEDSCGFLLFERTSGRLQPTLEAQRLYLETDKLITGVARVENIARSIRNLEAGQISVTAYPVLCMRLLPQVAADFLGERPDVNISIETRTSRQIFESMLTGVSEVGLSMVPTSHSGLECRLFHQGEMVCAVPPGHRFCEMPVIDLRELPGENYIALGREDLSTELSAEAFAQAGVSIEPTIRTQMADTACTFVSRGQGVAIVSPLATLAWADDQVCFRPIFPAPNQSVWLYSRASQPLSILAEHILKMLRERLDALHKKCCAAPEDIAQLPPLPLV